MSVLFPGETLVWSFLFSYKHTALFEASARVASCRLLLIILTGESRWQLPPVISLRETWVVVAKLAARVNETLHKQPSAVIVEEESAVWSPLPGFTSVSVTCYRQTESGFTSVSVTWSRQTESGFTSVSVTCYQQTESGFTSVSVTWSRQTRSGFTSVSVTWYRQTESGFRSVSVTYRCWGGIYSLVSSSWFNVGFTDVVLTDRVWFYVGFSDVVPTDRVCSLQSGLVFMV